VDLDPELLEQVKAFTSKIISERNLRKQRDLFLESISSCDKDKVDKLQSLIDIARQNEVEQSYIDSAQTLTSQMSGNITAREILSQL